MTQEPLASKLDGIVEVDETYVGSRNDGEGRRFKKGIRKTPVVTLVKRRGRPRSFVPLDVNGTNIDRILRQNMSRKAEIHTDEARWYTDPGKRFRSHQTVNHIKRGSSWTFHHVSAHHLHRYLTEFDFRYNRP